MEPLLALVAATTLAGQILKDCPTCPELVVIPAGEFTMGAREIEWKWWKRPEMRRYYDSQIPRHKVTLKSFAIGRFEITLGQWREFAEATDRSGDGGCFYWTGTTAIAKKETSWRNPGYAQDDDHPVACLNWDDANDYTIWLSQKTGRKYRLPSEAEWEYAARSGHDTMHTWGEDWENNEACVYANISDIGSGGAVFDCDDGYARTAPVGSFPANDWGVFDMEGNIGEWVQDCYHPGYDGAPVDGSVWKGPERCGAKVRRANSWVSGPWDSRLADRLGNPRGIRLSYIGFRIARDLN